MNASVFELHEMQQVVRRGSEVEKVSRFLAWPPGADEVLDEALVGLKIDAFAFQLLVEKTVERAGNRLPWALVQFRRNYRVAGHLRRVRSDPRALAFTSVSLHASHDVLVDGIPPVSTVFAFKKDALEEAAARSPLLAPAWALLAGARAEGHYFCLADPSDTEWVERQERIDDELFISQQGQRAPSWRGWRS